MTDASGNAAADEAGDRPKGEVPEAEVAEGQGDAVETVVGAPPDVVWAKIGDFGAIGDLFPALESFRVDGDDRFIGMFGLEIREHLLARDDQARSITYTVADGVPIESHRATITVRTHDDGSLVQWAFVVEPDSMMPVFADTYKTALQALQEHFS